MKSISLSGVFDADRPGRAFFPNDITAVHGGGTDRLSALFDEREIRRANAPGFSDAFLNDRRSNVFCLFHVPVVRVTGIPGGFEAVRNLHAIELRNSFAIRPFKANRYTWSPQDVFENEYGGPRREGEYGLSSPFRYDLKSRYGGTANGSFDAIFIGVNDSRTGTFHANPGDLEARFPFGFDSVREWTRDEFRFRYDGKYGAADLYPGTLDAVCDPGQWPNRFTDRASGLIANPRALRNLDLLRRDLAAASRSRLSYTYDVLPVYRNEYPARNRAFVRPGWRILAKNLETNEVADLGLIDAQNPDRSLENVSLPDGDYEIFVSTSSLFWRDARDGHVRTISVGAETEISPLPVIHNLRSAVSGGATRIYWSASRSELDDCVFGVWYSPEPFSEEATNESESAQQSGSSIRPPGRGPDATVWYSSDMTEYQASFAQHAPAWVAVAAMKPGEETKIGKVHELYLDWNDVKPRAPDDVMLLDAPLPAFDADLFERPEEALTF